MNLNMIHPKKQTEDLFISKTKNCETLFHQTHRKAEETFELKMIKPKQTFHSNPTIQTKGDWMIGLTSPKVCNSIFNINTLNNNFVLYTDTFDQISFEELKDEVEEIPSISDFTPHHLQHGTAGPRIIQAYWK